VSGRATSGESSLHADVAGRWHGYVSMGLRAGGQRDRRHVSGARRSEVVRKVRALEAQRDAGTAVQAGRTPTVAWWLDHWLTTIAPQRVRPSTLQGYESLLRYRIVPALGHHRLDRLQPEHLERLYADLRNDGLATSSVLKCHRVLSRALKVAVQRGRVGRNVAQLVDAPAASREEVQPLTAAEARQLLEAARGDRIAARWSVALSLGLRQGEALGLCWDDVDLQAGALRVRRALQRQAWRHGCRDAETCGRAAACPQRHGGGLVLVEPKSRAGRRSLALPLPLAQALRNHRVQQSQERAAVGANWQPQPHGGVVFAQANGCPIDPAADYKAWKKLLTSAGVRDARLHDARHTAATLLLQQGVPARVAMQILGHSHIGLTLGTYSHVVPELARDAADRMTAALWGPPAAPHGTAWHHWQPRWHHEPGGRLRGTRITAGQGGAAYRNRTDDLFITSESLCRLS